MTCKHANHLFIQHADGCNSEGLGEAHEQSVTAWMHMCATEVIADRRPLDPDHGRAVRLAASVRLKLLVQPMRSSRRTA